jgi:hypothetical protein
MLIAYSYLRGNIYLLPFLFMCDLLFSVIYHNFYCGAVKFLEYEGQIKVGNTGLDFHSFACAIKMPFQNFQFYNAHIQ